jgi:ATP-binding cassette subfamily B protein
MLPVAKSASADTWQDALNNMADEVNTQLEPIVIPYDSVEFFLRHLPPAIVKVSLAGEEGLIAIVQSGRDSVSLICSDMRVRRFSHVMVADAIRQQIDGRQTAEAAEFVQQVGVQRAQRPAAMREWLKLQNEGATLDDCWLLHPSASRSLLSWVWHGRILPLFGLLAGGQYLANSIQYLGIGIISFMVLSNRTEWGLLYAVCLTLLATTPLFLFTSWVSALYAVETIAVLKTRLLNGILRLQPDAFSQTGIGHFLAWILESASLERVGFSLVPLLKNLTTFAVVLVMLAIVQGTQAFLFALGWLAGVVIFTILLYRAHLAFKQFYAEMINDLIERLQGHETRLVQETDWFGEDDKAIAHYLSLYKRYDRMVALYQSFLTYSWLIGGLLILAPAFIHSPADPLLEISFAILLFAGSDIAGLAVILPIWVEIAVSWRLIRPIESAVKPPPIPMQRPEQITLRKPVNPPVGTLMTDMQALTFRYPARANPTIRNADLEIRFGDRVLLEGPSGGGKSTLASLLTGYLTSDSGLLFMWGADRSIIGDATWRRWIVYTPQFHQNHIISASLAFNLLMGRRWPPTAVDLDEAEALCRRLNLGALLDRMPYGLDERVGDDGWHLSHGERSRIYIARALLQKADLIILDESFASLDPENMSIALRIVLDEARTLLVIAHP